MKHLIPLHQAIPSYKYRMRFISAVVTAETLLDKDIGLSLEPMLMPKQAQQSTLEWVKNRNSLESSQKG